MNRPNNFTFGSAEHAAELQRLRVINESGYAGIDRHGGIVDRREVPDALPMPQNVLFNIPQPKPLE